MYRPHDIIASGSHRKPMSIEVMSFSGMQPGLTRAQAASLTAVTVNGLMGLGSSVPPEGEGGSAFGILIPIALVVGVGYFGLRSAEKNRLEKKSRLLRRR